MAPLARRLARAALAFDPATLPPAALAKAKTCLMDFLGCAFEARALSWSRQALATVQPVEAGAQVIGTDRVATPGDAAFVNAVMGHGLVREDMHAASISHHGVVVWPVLLALAQARPISGAAFLTAAVIGYESGARIGRALFDAQLARLFRPTGLVAPIGAALAGSRLLGLDEDGATHAIGIAANTSSGLNQWPHCGGSEMYFHPGFAARNAVTAALLARAGAFASEDILEGEAGLFAAFRRSKPSVDIELFADGHAEILEVYNKPVPACNFAQTACQAAVRIAPAVRDCLDGIASIAVRVPRAAALYPGCDFAGPYERPLQAKMSIQYGVAAALVYGAVEETNYRSLDEMVLIALIERTTLAVDEAFTQAFPHKQGADVTVVLRDGARHHCRLANVIPASPEQVQERFVAAAVMALGEGHARELQAAVDELELARDAGRVATLCATDRQDGHARTVQWDRGRDVA